MDSDRRNLSRLVAKIPLFEDLAPQQARQILSLCRDVNLQAGQTLFEEGTKSQEMYLLLSGKLFVRAQGIELGKIHPVGVVGEMGVLTGQPRCATIAASEGSRLFGIRKIQLDALLKKDPYLGMRVYKNLSRILCDKLTLFSCHFQEMAIGGNKHLLNIK